MAMADAPDVFTLPLWGYRILVPWIVRLLPLPTAQGFVFLGYAGLTLGGGLLYLFLRRLGCGALASMLGVAAYGLSAPVEQVVAYPFLVEPVTFVIVTALLLAVEAGAGTALLALLAVLGALAKEVTVFFLPVVYFARRERDGDKRAALTALLSTLPAVAITLLLRLCWAPSQAAPAASPLGSDFLWLALWRLIERSPDWWRSAALGGILPLALVGALRTPSRPIVRRYGYYLAVTLALPFGASVYTGKKSAPFFVDDIPRLLIYALPVLIGLALLAVVPVLRHFRQPPGRFRYATRTALVLSLMALVLAALPLVIQDRYRRADLSGPRDGRYVLAFCRESLAAAARLERGRTFDFEPEGRSFTVGKTLPSLAGRMRWFLREGWGPGAHYGTGPVVTKARDATLVLPCYLPEDWNVTLALSASPPMSVSVVVNGRDVGEVAAGEARDAPKRTLVIPGGLLFRGDNELRFSAPAPGLRLRGLRIRPAR